jgi:hypothetical protein
LHRVLSAIRKDIFLEIVLKIPKDFIIKEEDAISATVSTIRKKIARKIS